MKLYSDGKSSNLDEDDVATVVEYLKSYLHLKNISLTYAPPQPPATVLSVHATLIVNDVAYAQVSIAFTEDEFSRLHDRIRFIENLGL